MKLLLSIYLCLLCINASAEEFRLDWYTIEKEWSFIKNQLNAPDDLPMPPISIESNMPPAARMMFQFPVEDDGTEMRIMINSTTLINYNTEMIDWGIGHELTHYAFILRENSWELNKPSYNYTVKHHCNKEFMSITKNIADIVFDVYHGERERYRMWDEVQRSCALYPNQ